MVEKVRLMRRLLVLLQIPAILLQYSCQKWSPEEIRNKTILAYIAGDNGLYASMKDNIIMMTRGMSDILPEYNTLLAFVDLPGKNSCILEIRDNGTKVVMEWDENLESSSPEVMSMVIDYVKEEYPALSYDLIISSHGNGWLPSHTLPFVDPSGFPQVVGEGQPGILQDARFELTKAVNVELERNNVMKWMEISELVSAIPDGMFNCILMDACLMANAEAVYDLRGKADWIIASEIEVINKGFPYSYIMSDLFSENYSSVCRKFYEYYLNEQGSYRTAGVALIDMSRIDLVAEAFRGVVENAQVSVDRLDLKKGLQRCDRFRNHVFFDLLDVAEKLEPGEEALENLREALSACLSSVYHTEYSVGEIKLEHYCGLSCYVPAAIYEWEINPYYSRTEWNKVTGFYEYSHSVDR